MAILPTTCPHCFKENVAFYSIADFRSDKGNRPYLVFFMCGNCHGGLVAEMDGGYGSPHENRSNLLDYGFTIFRTYPRVPAIEAPDHLPDNVARIYLQAADNLRRKHWDASGTMSRKALDVATLSLKKGITGSLWSRIDLLAADHLITSAMQEWAHAIRDDGNKAAHEEEFNEETAKDLFAFTELFLMYAFTLPEMLRIRRNRTT